MAVRSLQAMSASPPIVTPAAQEGSSGRFDQGVAELAGLY
jgi:hypothetical protein